VNAEAADLWGRARRALTTASGLTGEDPDSAASRAYYAAFHAVSALFAIEGRQFAKHSAVEAAVHRDLVKAGRWEADLGADYSALLLLRETGDYGGRLHVSAEDAGEAVRKARRILDVVRKMAGTALPEDSANSSPDG
jgi:uncharacterized protein (UPF0332 family)